MSCLDYVTTVPRLCRRISLARTVVFLSAAIAVSCMPAPAQSRAARAAARVKPNLQAELAEQGLAWGAPIFIRIFKRPAELEIWAQDADQFKLFKTYPICTYSGDLGPKLQQGDHQAPEGFYFIRAHQLNPASSYHLSFNLGYPNAYDRAHSRTGDYLMVHGDCVSIGCYAMTDPAIEEIYTLLSAALEAGQPFVRVHIFPFPLTDKALGRHKDSKWNKFWNNLAEGYRWFEEHKFPPNVEVRNKRYTFNAP